MPADVASSVETSYLMGILAQGTNELRPLLARPRLLSGLLSEAVSE
jgi:hypothetical protein